MFLFNDTLYTFYLQLYGIRHGKWPLRIWRGNLLPPHGQQGFFYTHHPTDTIPHTTAFATPVVEHWLEWEIAQWVHREGIWSDSPSHHEQTLLPRSYISLPNFRGRIVKLIHNDKWQSFLSPAGKTTPYTHDWFQQHHVTILEWPADLSDLKPYKKMSGRLWKTVLKNFCPNKLVTGEQQLWKYGWKEGRKCFI